MKGTSINLFTAGIILGSIFIPASEFPVRRSRSADLPHEVVFRETDMTEEKTGSVILLARSRDGNDAEEIPTDQIRFFLIRTDLSMSDCQRSGAWGGSYAPGTTVFRNLEGNDEYFERINREY